MTEDSQITVEIIVFNCFFESDKYPNIIIYRTYAATGFLNEKSPISSPKSGLETLFPITLLPYYPLPITHYPLPITHYPLPITHYPLPITHYPLPITHYPLPITHYPLPITHYPLPITSLPKILQNLI